MSIVLVVIALGLLMWLGTWQLGRYDEKVRDESLAEERSQKAAVEKGASKGLEKLSLQKILPKGSFGNQTHVIKHRIRNGKPGYWIVRPFNFDDGTKVLVNIGWYPKIKSVDFAKTLESPKNGWTGLVHVLDRNVVDTGTRETNCQLCVWDTFDVLNMNKLSLKRNSMLILVAGESKSAGQYPVASFKHVVEPYMTSEKHLGYALTWYGLGAGLVLLFLGAGFGVLGRR